MERTVICIKDICGLLGVSRNTAAAKLRLCRQALNKQPYQYVTINEFRQFFGI